MRRAAADPFDQPTSLAVHFGRTLSATAPSF